MSPVVQNADMHLEFFKAIDGIITYYLRNNKQWLKIPDYTLSTHWHVGTDLIAACVPSAEFYSLDCNSMYFYM